MKQTDLVIRFFDGRVDFEGMSELGKAFEKIIAEFSGRDDVSIETELEEVDGDPLYIFKVRHEDDCNDVGFFWEEVDETTLDIIKEF